MTSEQAALVRKAHDSLKASRLLMDQGYTDFAVSRAYYAMFYIAQAMLLREGAAFSRHSAVISAFGQRFAKTGVVPAEFHRYLIEAQASRNIGDYDIGPGLTPEDAKGHIARAEEFLKLAEHMFGKAT